MIIVVCLLFLQDGGDEDALHGRRGRPLRPVDRGHHQHRLRHLWTHRQRHLHLVRINKKLHGLFGLTERFNRQNLAGQNLTGT